MAWQLGRHLGYGALEPEPLLERIAVDPRPLRLLVTDLHLAGCVPTHVAQAAPQPVITELVAPLLTLPQVRAVVEVDDPRLLRYDRALELSLPSRTPVKPSLAFGPVLPADSPWVPRPRAENVPPVLDGKPTAPPPAGPGATEPVLPLFPAGAGWRAASSEVREGAIRLAYRSGIAYELLRDPGYLAYGPIPAITAALSGEAAPAELSAVWNAAGPALSSDGLHGPERASVVRLAALGHDVELAEAARPLTEGSRWNALWHRPGAAVPAVAPLPGSSHGAGTVVTADSLGRCTERVLSDGSAVRRLPTQQPLVPTGLAALSPDFVLTLDDSGTLRSTRLVDGSPLPATADRLMIHHNAHAIDGSVAAASAIAAHQGQVAVGDTRGLVSLWSLTDHLAGPRTVRLHEVGVTAVACLTVEAGVTTTLVVSGGLDGTIRLWDSTSGEVMPGVVERRQAIPLALALADTDAAGPVLATAWSDLRLHIWHLRRARMISVPLLFSPTGMAISSDGVVIVTGPAGAAAVRIDLLSSFETAEA
ncbi:hypothetical protein ACFU7Y_19715 [Kitasatospora sp. NPDC057542]|uniref:hypothetical protein n=1 Tax=Streptomycetaceae TaxID=2062 RepID=UPI001CCC630E|nr:hypothetical protein [Streptomyces sp. LS1784]